MNILTVDNTVINLDLLGTNSSNTRFSVFDHSLPKEADYYFKSLVFLESFNDCALEFSIGSFKIQLPKDWSILMGDPELGDIELVPVDEINNRNFHAFVFNPLTGYYPTFLPIKLEDLFTDVRWVFPKLDAHNFLLVPLENRKNPNCIFIINEKDQKKIPPIVLENLL